VFSIGLRLYQTKHQDQRLADLPAMPLVFPSTPEFKGITPQNVHTLYNTPLPSILYDAEVEEKQRKERELEEEHDRKEEKRLARERRIQQGEDPEQIDREEAELAKIEQEKKKVEEENKKNAAKAKHIKGKRKKKNSKRVFGN